MRNSRFCWDCWRREGGERPTRGSRLIRKLLEELRTLKFREIADNLKQGRYSLDESLKKEFEAFRTRLHEDLEHLGVTISNFRPKMEVAPVMKWGQSELEVHIFLKMSHRFDSPGCLELTKEPEVSIDGNRLRFMAECVQAQYPMIFVLDFGLLREVTSFRLERMSIGNYRLVLVKAEGDIWEDLFADFEDRTRFTVKVWYELEDRYPEAMEQFYAKMERYFKAKKEEKKRRGNRPVVESCVGHLKQFSLTLKDRLRPRFCVKKK